MLSRIYSPSKKDDGFTLLELLIVVIVIGVLAAIALPIFIDQQKVAIDAAVKSDVHNTALAVQEWRVDHQSATAADAAAYLAQNGHLVATANNGYLGVVVNSDGSYGVCGYNPKGAKLTSPTSSFVFEGTSGKFGIGTGCYSAVGYVTDNPTSTPDPANTDDPHNGTPVPTAGDTTPGSGSTTPAGGSYRTDPHPNSRGTTEPKIGDGGGPTGGSGTIDPGPSTPPSTPPNGGTPGGSDSYVNPYPSPSGVIRPTNGGFYSNWYNAQCMNITPANNPNLDPDSTCLRFTGAVKYHDALNGTDYAWLLNGTVSQQLSVTYYGNGMHQTSAKHSWQATHVDANGKIIQQSSSPIYSCADTGLAGSCDFYVPMNDDNWPQKAAGYCATINYNSGQSINAYDNKAYDKCMVTVAANN